MRFALGMYTEMSPSTPVPAFRRALSLLYRPVLSYLYNNPGKKMALYQSSAMIRHIDSSSSPEVNMLIASLSKRGDLELITGSYSQAILSLNPTKDRSLQIEKMTTLIRRVYGVKASSCFFYGQIWSPTFIHTLKSLGLSSVVISAYKATTRETVERESFTMNELGRRVRISVPSDEAASLVSQFAQGMIGFDSLYLGIKDIVDRCDGECFLFLNIDQLLEGAARDGSDERLASLIIDLLESHPDSTIPLSSLSASRPGYLDSGWYGRDAWARNLRSFNDLFVRNENFRYMLNRYTCLVEFLSSFKKDKTIRREAESELFHISMGPLFIHDAECTPLRYGERKAFWKAITEAERRIYDAEPLALAREYDYEEIGLPDQVARNRTYTAVLSSKGGALAELCYKPLALNVIDTRIPFDREFPTVPLNKSFSDILEFGGREMDLSERIYDTDVISRASCEYQFMLQDEAFSIIKHIRLRSQTLVVETIITAGEDIDGSYRVPVFLSSPDISLSSLEQRQKLMLGSLDDVKTVRYTDSLTGLQISFSSTEGFSLAEERVRQSQNTSLGVETFELYTRIVLSFPLSIAKGESKVIRIVARTSDNRKDKE